jgi:hypothetical protein
VSSPSESLRVFFFGETTKVGTWAAVKRVEAFCSFFSLSLSDLLMSRKGKTSRRAFVVFKVKDFGDVAIGRRFRGIFEG